MLLGSSLLASNFSFVLISFKLLLIPLISVGYILINYKIRSSRVNNISKNRTKHDMTFMIRVSMIVATDIACWFPIIVFTYTSYFGLELPDIVTPLSSIVLLPINSFINPLLYSRVEVILYDMFKYCVLKTHVIIKKISKKVKNFRCFKNIQIPITQLLKTKIQKLKFGQLKFRQLSFDN